MNPVTKHEEESQTEFAIRAICYEVWDKAHEDICAWSNPTQCPQHVNPYGDKR